MGADKKYVIFAGINGVGKTALHKILDGNINIGERISIDDIAAELGDWRDPMVQIKAASAILGSSKRGSQVLKQSVSGIECFSLTYSRLASMGSATATTSNFSPICLAMSVYLRPLEPAPMTIRRLVLVPMIPSSPKIRICI